MASGPCNLTDDQCEAIKSADAPSAANPFVTQSELSKLPPAPPPPISPIGLTPAQDAALDAAEASTTPLHRPSENNPFVTRSMLPAEPAPTQWPIGLTPAQDDALDAAEAYPEEKHKPGLLNPFLTQSRWDETAPTLPQKEALDNTRHPPSKDNPFATMQDVSSNGAGPCDLDRDHCDAIRNGLGSPSGDNPFVTKDCLPNGKPPQDWPIGVTEMQKKAMDRAHQPGDSNPFATMIDLSLSGITTRVVAAGNLDLRGNTSSPVLGGLKLVTTEPASGLATLSFEGYRLDRQAYYIVKALPVNGQAGLKLESLTVVQLAEFTAQGFVLHMSQPLTKSTNLGRCMIEVSEMLEGVAPAESSLEQAIRTYYLLIRQKHYADAWPMLSQRYRNSHGQTIFDPNDQENPIPGFDPAIRGYRAEVVVRLKRGGTILNAAAANSFAHRIVHLNSAGDPLDAPWKGKFDQDANRPNFGVWHVVKREDVRENNSDWYRCEIYNGEPQDWNNPGEPIAITRAFQLPRTSHEQVITVELDHPVSQPLDLARFIQEWEATGPAEIRALKRAAATPERATYDLDLLYTYTNLSRRIRYEFECDAVEGHPRFDFWLFVQEKVLP